MRRLVLIALLLAGLALPSASPEAQIRFSAIRNKLIRLALDQVSSPGSFEIQVRSIEDGDDGLTSLVQVEVSDGAGVWMELERVNFAWEPRRLVSGELAITRLEFIGVTVTRKPSGRAELPRLKAQPPWRRGPFDWPRSPIALSLEGIRLQRVSVAEGVLAQPIRFDAEARASDKGDLQELSLRLRRTDAIDGRIVLHTRRDFAADSVQLEVVAEEAAGGMTAAMAGFPEDAPARLALTADGPPEDWRLSFEAAVERVFTARGQATVSHAEDLRAKTELTVKPGPAMRPRARTLLGDSAQLRVTLVQRSDDTLEIATGELSTPALTIAASGTVAPQATGRVDWAAATVRLDYTVHAPDLGPLARAYNLDAAGTLNAQGRARGPANALHLRGTASVADAFLDTRSYGRVSVTHDLTVAEALEGRVTLALRGSWLGDGHARAKLRLDETAARLTDLRAEALNLRLASDGMTIDLDSRAVSGSGRIRSTELEALGSLVGVPLRAAVDGRFVLSSSDGRQALELKLDLSDASFYGLDARRMKVELRAEDLLHEAAMELTAAARDARFGPFALDSAEASATGGLDHASFAVSAQGKLAQEQAGLTVAGQIDGRGEVTEVLVHSANVQLSAETIRLAKPLRATLGGDGFEITGLDLRLGSGGSITGNTTGTPTGLHGRLSAVRVPMAVVSRLADMPVMTGHWELDARFDTRAPTPSARLEARGREIVFAGLANKGAVDVDVDGTWDGARLVTRSEIRGPFDTPMRARLALAVGVGKRRLPVFTRSSEIEGAVVWQGRLERLWALVPTTRHQLDGDVDLDVRVAGSVEAPRLSGRAGVTRGEYRSVDAGTALTDLAIQARLAGNDRISFTATASDQDQGGLTATGSIQGRSVDVDLRIDRAMLLRRDDVTALVSGAARLEGTFADLALRGNLVVDRAEFRLVDAAPPEVVELEGIRIEGEAQEGREDGPGVLSLNLAVKADRAVSIRGRGLDSEWRMNLTATGTPTAPVLTGTLQRIRGRLDLVGKPFDLVRGLITFDGTGGLEPWIDVGLERDANGHQGGLHLSGRASDPRIRFVSRSGLPDEEVLPQLLFGVSRQSLTVAQGLQLSVALANLFGKGIGFGLQENLRTAARLDELQLGATDADSDSVSVTVGKNLGDLFVGARQSIIGRGSSIVIELNLSDNLVVDSELTNDRGSNIGVKWHKDF